MAILDDVMTRAMNGNVGKLAQATGANTGDTRRARCITALAALLSSSALAADPTVRLTELPVSGTTVVKPANYIAASKIAALRGTPVEVALAIAGRFEGSAQHIIEVNEGGESPVISRVTVLRDGLPDDSIRGERWEVVLAKGPEGSWTIAEVRRAWRCWRGPQKDRFVISSCP